MITNDTKPRTLPAIIAWCLYDGACASFSIIVTTFVFATYFTTKVADNPIIGTYQWANASALAGFLIAFSSPLFGAIADHSGRHKRWLFFFSWLCIVSALLLWFAYPAHYAVYFTLSCVVLGSLGLEVALVFYNAFLPHLAPPSYLGRISGWGWGSGYIGGILALSIALFVFIKADFLGLNKDTAQHIRICGPFTALWYALFSLPFFLLAPEIAAPSRPLPQAVKTGLKDLIITLKQLPQDKPVLLYLLSHMIYTDGLNTLFAFGGIYAANTFGLSFAEVLEFGICMNISAGIGAMSFAWVDDYLGSKITILLSLFFLVLFGIPLVFIKSKAAFWSVSLLLCIFVGPAQSASRSLMARLMTNKQASAEMFGLYALSGRISAFIGPWLFGVMTLFFDSQRAGMVVVIVFFFLGGLLLLPVRTTQT